MGFFKDNLWKYYPLQITDSIYIWYGLVIIPSRIPNSDYNLFVKYILNSSTCLSKAPYYKTSAQPVFSSIRVILNKAFRTRKQPAFILQNITYKT